MKKMILAAMVILLLSGCATPLQPQAFNKQANASLKTIAVLPMREMEVNLYIHNNPGYNFGLIGGLIAEADRNGKQNWLEETVNRAGFNKYQVFQMALTQAMAERGYQLVWPASLTEDKSASKRDKYGLHASYSPITNADAILDIGLNYVGYVAAGAGDAQPYRPTIDLTVRLLSTDGQTVLYTDAFNYNNYMAHSGVVVIEPNPIYAYADFGTLKAADIACVAGLREALQHTAQTMASHL